MIVNTGAHLLVDQLNSNTSVTEVSIPTSPEQKDTAALTKKMGLNRFSSYFSTLCQLL